MTSSNRTALGAFDERLARLDPVRHWNFGSGLRGLECDLNNLACGASNLYTSATASTAMAEGGRLASRNGGTWSGTGFADPVLPAAEERLVVDLPDHIAKKPLATVRRSWTADDLDPTHWAHLANSIPCAA